MRRHLGIVKYAAAAAALILFSTQTALHPCTVAVVSGKATPDGRALLWKNRDTSSVDNKVVYIEGSRFAFLAVVAAQDSMANSIWQGLNEKGFAIMNSMSSDLATDPRGYYGNGLFMRKALETCADAVEFEKLLEETNGTRKVAANYGVIDASGGACIFETGPESFVKFDANDPRVAPAGYIVRTNYAFTAPEKNKGGGYIRFERASHLFQRAAAEGRLDYRFILREAARDLVNEKLLSHPLSHPLGRDAAHPLYIRTNDTISRASTVSVSVFHGAPGPDRADLATMWTLLGQPSCSVALPLWVRAKGVPEALTGPETAPLNDLAKALAAWLYPDQRANMKQYLHVTRLLTFGGEGVLARLFKIEDRVMAETEKMAAGWAASPPDADTVADFMHRTAASALQELRETFAEILTR